MNANGGAAAYFHGRMRRNWLVGRSPTSHPARETKTASSGRGSRNGRTGSPDSGPQIKRQGRQRLRGVQTAPSSCRCLAGSGLSGQDRYGEAGHCSLLDRLRVAELHRPGGTALRPCCPTGGPRAFLRPHAGHGASARYVSSAMAFFGISIGSPDANAVANRKHQAQRCHHLPLGPGESGREARGRATVPRLRRSPPTDQSLAAIRGRR
jgi:hypothetical protein